MVLAVPFFLKTDVKEFVDVFQIDTFFGAASWRHVLWVGCRKGEDATEARITHAVFAG